MRPIYFLLFLLIPVIAEAAPVPVLEESHSAIICKPSKGGWLPTKAEVQKLEAAIPAYFRALNLKRSALPNSAHQYARTYTGIVQDGKRYIYGSFSPASSHFASQLKQCSAGVLDGGNDYWDLHFDPSTGAIVAFGVHGVA